jgi:hypothetical protein
MSPSGFAEAPGDVRLRWTPDLFKSEEQVGVGVLGGRFPGSFRVRPASAATRDHGNPYRQAADRVAGAYSNQPIRADSKASPLLGAGPWEPPAAQARLVPRS